MAIQTSGIRSRLLQAALVLAALCLASAPAWANSCIPGTICFDNSGGTMTGGSGGFYLNGTNGSTMSTITSVNGMPAGGTLSFTTGSEIGTTPLGSLTVGESVDFNAGSFSISGTYGGYTGVLFSGTFGGASGPIVWTLTGKVGNTYTYSLTGPVYGTWFTGYTTYGATTQLFFKSKSGPYSGGPISLENGSSYLVTPEPSTLGLMGTGLLGLGFSVRQRARNLRKRRVS